MNQLSDEYYEGSSSDSAQKTLGSDTVRMANEETEQTSSQPRDFDEMLTSILKDLEFAEVSLQSTSHLLDSSDNDVNTEDRSETEENQLGFNPAIGDTTDVSAETFTFTKEFNKDEKACNEQEPKMVAMESDLPTPSPQNFEEEIKRFIKAWDEGAKREMKEKGLKDCSKKSDNSTSNRSEIETDLKVPLPNANPYINFVQDFKAKYKGQEVTPTTLIALAAAKWRKMSKTEKQVYKNISKNHFKRNKQVEKLKSYIKSYKMSEECLFQNPDL